jgi:hypothetical protein
MHLHAKFVVTADNSYICLMFYRLFGGFWFRSFWFVNIFYCLSTTQIYMFVHLKKMDA